jgi:16S rRNA (uracil1498-N3)-methyltransferase
MRIFVAQLAAGELTITGDEHHYVHRVRRARPGDALELVDGAGHRASAVIERITGEATIVRAGIPELVPDASPRIRVLLPLIKGDRMDVCLEKLVEVGADEIVVWPAARAVVRLDGDRLDARIAKFRTALQAAARQCGRASVPTVTAAGSLVDAIGLGPPAPALTAAVPPPAVAADVIGLPASPEVPAPPTIIRLVLDPGAERAAISPADDITIISGPEGGLAPDELDALAAAGFASLGLGPRVLRAETAPVIAVALVRAATNS